jgi:RimJ/RimL family protein N-acetyltransferase
VNSSRLRIRPVEHADRERVRAFLRENEETSLFLASNLAAYGLRLSEHLNSGNFKLIEGEGGVRAVFCLTRRGNLLAESAGHAEYADAILMSCDDEAVPVSAVVGEWKLGSALWRRLLDTGRLKALHCSKERLYRLALDPQPTEEEISPHVRRLQPGDFEPWRRLNEAYFAELGFPLQGTMKQRQTAFRGKAEAGHWWGYFDGDELQAIAGLNACHDATGQIGGVYTVEARRRQGLARTLMRALVADSSRVHGLSKLILFTSPASPGAPQLYESLGFEHIGDFALLFGEPADTLRPNGSDPARAR